MYIVNIKNNGVSIPIHNSKEKLTSGKVTKGINTIDSFQFSMLPSNVGFNQINDYTTLATVYNTSRKRYEFYGRVLYSEDTMSDSGAISKDVICESFFGFFCDSQQEYVEERNWTVGGLLQHIVNKHNSQVESYKQFTIGEVTVTDPNDNIYCGIQRKNTWETLKEKLLDVLGGELRFRVEGGVIYLDYLVEIGETSSTEIALSKNMKSIAREKDPSEIVTRLIPLGCKRKTKDAEGKEVETEYRLDISSVNNGKNYIEDETAVGLYGIRVATVLFDDVTVASTLLVKGENWLEENNKIKVSYTATALDLSLIGLDVDDFNVCNYHPLKNHLLGINDTVRIIKKSIDICEEYKSTIEFGDNFEKLSDAMKKHSDTLNLITSNYVTNQKFTSELAKTSTLIEQTEEKIRLEVEGISETAKETNANVELLDDKVSLIVTTSSGENVIDSASIIAAINGDTSAVTINASKIDLTAYAKTSEVYDTAFGAAEDAISGITLTATNGDTSSTISITHNGVNIASAEIELTGLVTFSDLETAGNTTIHGSNIETGTLTVDKLAADNDYYMTFTHGILMSENPYISGLKVLDFISSDDEFTTMIRKMRENDTLEIRSENGVEIVTGDYIIKITNNIEGAEILVENEYGTSKITMGEGWITFDATNIDFVCNNLDFRDVGKIIWGSNSPA